MIHTIKLLFIYILCSTFLLGQTPPEKNPSEDAEKLRKEAVLFLRETRGDVNGMRSLENRISFTAEMAALMWFHDEREARAIYSGAITDYRDLLLRYDGQMNMLGITAEEGETRYRPMAFMMEPSDRDRILRKVRTTLAVGQQIAMSLAEHDPELAWSFYYDSLGAVSNPEFKKQADNGNIYFESQLLTRIAENNAGKAAQLGARSLAKGFSNYHLELLKKIHAKDPDKAVDFGSAILSRLKAEKINTHDFYLVVSLLEFGGQTLEQSRKPGGKKAVYTMAELREIAELFAQAILSRTEADVGSGLSHLGVIQKYSPGRAAQIKAKFRKSSALSNYNSMANANVMTRVGESEEYGYAGSNSNSNTGRYERERQEREEREKAEKKLFDDVQSLSTKQLPKKNAKR
jgi:hypothetical protein